MFFRPLYKAFIFGLIIFFAWTNNCELALAKISLNESNQSIEPYLNQVKEDITEFTLSNGIHFIVLENHQAPVISFNTYVDVGGANEPEGKTGVAHFFRTFSL